MDLTIPDQFALIDYIDDQQIHYLYYIQLISKRHQFVVNYLVDNEHIMIANNWLMATPTVSKYDYKVKRVVLKVTEHGEALLKKLGTRRIALASLRVGDLTGAVTHIAELKLSDLPEVLASRNILTRMTAESIYDKLTTSCN